MSGVTYLKVGVALNMSGIPEVGVVRADFVPVVAKPHVPGGSKCGNAELGQERGRGKAISDPEAASEKVEVPRHEDDGFENLSRQFLDGRGRGFRLEGLATRALAAVIGRLVVVIPPSLHRAPWRRGTPWVVRTGLALDLDFGQGHLSLAHPGSANPRTVGFDVDRAVIGIQPV